MPGPMKVLIAVVSAFAVLAVGYAALSNTDAFEIESIEVEGSTRLSDSYLTSAVSVPKGSNLLNVDTAGIVESVSSSPWVDSVSVMRSFPHTLVLKIDENEPVAVVSVEVVSVDGTETEYWLIDSDGVWMGEVSEDGVDEARQIVIDSTSEDETETGGEFEGTESDDGDSDDGTEGDAGEGSSDESSDDGSDDGSDDSTESDSEAEDGDGSDGDDPEDDGTEDQDGDLDDGSSEGSEDGSADDASVSSDVYYTVEELSQIPIITEVSSDVSPALGQQEDDEGIVNALEIIQDSEGDFGDQIATITSANGSSTSVILTNGIEVSFGEAEDMEEKITVAEELMEQYPDQISYINVRVASMPSWRSVDQ